MRESRNEVAYLEAIFHLGHIACLPPSTGSVAPVIKDESLDARKAITLATSSTCPGRPKACVSLQRSKN